MAHGVYGASALTALTAQNTRAVQDIHDPGAAFTAAQIDAVLDDLDVAAVKTGMLFSAETVAVVAEKLAETECPLVVDPVCVAQSGAELLKPEAVGAMVAHLLPLAALVTPNKPEAERLSGVKIKSSDDVEQAARVLLEAGAGAVLLKGGHFPEKEMRHQITDWLVLPDAEPLELPKPRLKTRNLHGTGCTLSAAVTAQLALGLDLRRAVMAAKDYLHLGLRTGFKVGDGNSPVNHMAEIIRRRAVNMVLEELHQASVRMRQTPTLAALVPQVRMNMALALPYANSGRDIAGFEGRISAGRDNILLPAGCPRLGGAEHLAQTLLGARSVRPDLRCVANIRCDAEIITALETSGMRVAWFERHSMPGKASEHLEKGIAEALRTHEAPGEVDAVCDRGGIGLEPQTRVFGHSAAEVLDKLERLAGRL
jgi:hydroxymethylpyrimidine/phosphomethylpyrimidine kinase